MVIGRKEGGDEKAARISGGRKESYQQEQQLPEGKKSFRGPA